MFSEYDMNILNANLTCFTLLDKHSKCIKLISSNNLGVSCSCR